MKRYQCILAALFAVLCCSLGQALEYPQKPLTIIVPADTGGATDIATRAFVKYFQRHFPRDVQVLNIVGSGGAIGYNEFLKSPDPSGHTVIMQLASMPLNHAIGTYGYTRHDFSPVSALYSGYLCLCVRSDSNVMTFADFEAQVKADPEFRYGVFSNSPSTGVLLALEEYLGIQLRVIDLPPEGKQSELLAGRLEATSDFFSQMRPFIDSGDFRALGVFTKERLPEYPDIPTFEELGLVSPLTDQVLGVFADKDTPAEIVAYLDQAIRETFENEPELIEELNRIGYIPSYLGTEGYIAWLDDIFTRYMEKIDEM